MKIYIAYIYQERLIEQSRYSPTQFRIPELNSLPTLISDCGLLSCIKAKPKNVEQQLVIRKAFNTVKCPRGASQELNQTHFDPEPHKVK